MERSGIEWLNRRLIVVLVMLLAFPWSIALSAIEPPTDAETQADSTQSPWLTRRGNVPETSYERVGPSKSFQEPSVFSIDSEERNESGVLKHKASVVPFSMVSSLCFAFDSPRPASAPTVVPRAPKIRHIVRLCRFLC